MIIILLLILLMMKILKILIIVPLQRSSATTQTWRGTHLPTTLPLLTQAGVAILKQLISHFTLPPTAAIFLLVVTASLKHCYCITNINKTPGIGVFFVIMWKKMLLPVPSSLLLPAPSSSGSGVMAASFSSFNYNYFPSCLGLLHFDGVLWLFIFLCYIIDAVVLVINRCC